MELFLIWRKWYCWYWAVLYIWLEVLISTDHIGLWIRIHVGPWLLLMGDSLLKDHKPRAQPKSRRLCMSTIFSNETKINQPINQIVDILNCTVRTSFRPYWSMYWNQFFGLIYKYAYVSSVSLLIFILHTSAGGLQKLKKNNITL